MDDSMVDSVFDDGGSEDNFSPVVAVVRYSLVIRILYPIHQRKPTDFLSTTEVEGQGCAKSCSSNESCHGSKGRTEEDDANYTET